MSIDFLSDVQDYRSNNFDLIRLLASIQVFFMHAFVPLRLTVSPSVAEVLDWFPGVPIFFMISGILVTHSFVRLASLSRYFRNRVFRIFPGLWVCLAVSFLFAAWQGDLEGRSLFLKTAIWVSLQGSFFQFVNFWINPGVTNGALWSISTELQFYFVLPFVAIYGRRFLRSRVGVSAVLIIFSVASAMFHQWVLSSQDELLPKLFPTFYASILANGYLFAFGALIYLWQGKLLPVCRGRFVGFLAVYVILRLALVAGGISPAMIHATFFGLVVYPLLGLVVYSFSYSFPGLSQRILNGNDFSYGIYIYHMPMIYMSLHMQLEGAWGLIVTAGLVALFAAMSWIFIERSVLKLKRDVDVPSCESPAVDVR